MDLNSAAICIRYIHGLALNADCAFMYLGWIQLRYRTKVPAGTQLAHLYIHACIHVWYVWHGTVCMHIEFGQIVVRSYNRTTKYYL